MSHIKRPNEHYLNIARALKSFVPSLSKYSRRKRLTRYEKSAIRRAANKVRAEGNVVALTKKQAKKVDPKLARTKNGLRLAVLNYAQPGDKLSVTKDGNIKVRTPNGRVYRSIVCDYSSDYQSILEAAETAFERARGPIAIHTLNPYGRSGVGFGDIESLEEYLYSDQFGKYREKNIWLVGIVVVEYGKEKSQA